MRNYLLVAALAGTIIGGAAAVAQEAPGGRGRGAAALMRMDANHDGVITRAEAIAQATERFDRMDANHDGKIDSAEMANLRGARQGRGGDDQMPPPPPQAPPAGE